MDKYILSLCDYSGAWAAPFRQFGGYRTILVDPKHAGVNHGGRGLTEYAGKPGAHCYLSARHFIVPHDSPMQAKLPCTVGILADALDNGDIELPPIAGILAAPPCTDFSSSGARWFADKDKDGRTAASLRIVHDCLRVIAILKPGFWVLENPVGRLARLVPELGAPRLRFNPCDYAGFADNPAAEAYTKRTCLWGDFNRDLPANPVEPVYYTKGGKRGSWQWANLGGKSERTKELRSMTPQGFARAFAAAQDRKIGDRIEALRD